MGPSRRARQRRNRHPSSLMAKLATFGGIVLLLTFLALVNLELLFLHHNVDNRGHAFDHTSELPSKLTQETQGRQYMRGWTSAPYNSTNSRSSADSQDRYRDSGVQIGAVGFPPELPPLDEAFKSSSEFKSPPDYEDMRVAVLVPFSGPGLPVWFDAFAELAAANSELVDWKIFCDKELAQIQTPPNVHMIPTSPQELAWYLAGIVYPANADKEPHIYINDYINATRQAAANLQNSTLGRITAAKFISLLLRKNPYYMVEFKPALGWVFRKHLEGYSHWAFGDLDVFVGDLTKGWLEPEELRNFDIVTYSFGDQNRAYLRGQLTVHKTIDEVNCVWRRCGHLSRFLERIQRTKKTRKYQLESAEGCYSAAVMASKKLKVKYAVKVFTDMPGGGYQGREVDVVITGDALVKRCPATSQRVGEEGGPLASARRMQEDVGLEIPVEVAPPSEECEYWIRPAFQTCLNLTKKKSNVYLIDGQYYEREFRNLWVDHVEENCSMGAFHHFQEFKANYRVWNTRPPIPPVHKGMIAGKWGLVPLPNGSWRDRAMDPSASPPLRRDRFTHRYCMRWQVTLSNGKVSFSCAVSVTANDALREVYHNVPMYSESAKARPRAQAQARARARSVTLGGVGVMGDLEDLLLGVEDWVGPKILVLLLTFGEYKEAKSATRLAGLEDCVVMAFLIPDEPVWEDDRKHVLHKEVPLKTLYNALSDLCETRYLVTLATGFRIGRGTEAALSNALAQRTSKPRVLVLSQWCLHSSSPKLDSMDMDDMQRESAAEKASFCHQRLSTDIDRKVCFGAAAMEKAMRLWEENVVAPPGRSASTLYPSDMGDLSPSNTASLLRSDLLTPILMVDLWSAPALFLRHVEEFARSRCFDGAYARGLLAAGFSFEVVPGAFAFTSREIPPSSNCHHGVEVPAQEYSNFLQDVRRVYSDLSPKRIDNFAVIEEGHQKLFGQTKKGSVSHKPFKTRVKLTGRKWGGES